MSWQLGLTRFLHGLPHFVGPAHAVSDRVRSHVQLPPALPIKTGLTIDREGKLLPALIVALFDFEGRFGAWPPTRVSALLDLAGLDHATTSLHLQGASLPSSFHRRPLSRAARQQLLLEGLTALDEGLLAATGAYFDALSPTLRGYVLSSFERGEFGLCRDAAERFMDCMVETVTFAFLNWELELTPLDGHLSNDFCPAGHHVQHT